MIDYRYGFDSQDFEYWEVDPMTWLDRRLVGTVSSCSRLQDVTKQTYESASMTIADTSFGEQWVRGYMRVRQGREQARIPLGAWLAQKAEKRADGMVQEFAATLYSPLIVLANRDGTGNRPPIGYTVPAGVNCVRHASQLMAAHGIAPVVPTSSGTVLDVPLVAGTRDSWLDVCQRLAEAAGCRIAVDAMGRPAILPVQANPRPSWEFQEGDGSRVVSMLSPEATERYDTFDVPNAVEVVWTNGGRTIVGRAEDLSSRSTSMASRGFEQALRLENPPELQAGCNQWRADALAVQKMAEAMRVTRTIEVSHAFCPVRAGDVVSVDYPSAGIAGKGTVTRQSVDFEVGATCSSTIEVVEEVL